MRNKHKDKTPLEIHQEYVDFLQKALKSENFKKNDPERYEAAKAKYDKAKLKLKFLKEC